MDDEIESVAQAFYSTAEFARGWDREPEILKQEFRVQASLAINALDGFRDLGCEQARSVSSLGSDWDPPMFLAVVEGPKHIFRMSNKAHHRLTGYRALMGKPVREAAPEVAGQGFFEMLDEVYETGIPCIGQHIPLRIRTRRGGHLEDRIIDFAYKPIIGEGRRRIGILMEGHDVT